MIKSIMDSQIKLDFSESVISPELKEHKETFAREFYKLLAHRFYSQCELELELSMDLVDVIWQVPYDKLSAKLKNRYDKFVDSYVTRIIKNEDEFLILMGVLDKNVDRIVINQFVSSYKALRHGYPLKLEKEKDSESLRGIIVQQSKIIQKLSKGKSLTKKDISFIEKIAKDGIQN